MKVCTKCGQAKPATAEFFQPYPQARFGFRNQCRACVNARRNERYQPKPSRRDRFNLAPPTVWTCKTCGETKPLTSEFFAPNAKMVSGFENDCKTCQTASRIAWRKAHPGRDYETQKRYNARHPEKIRAYFRAYWAKNREHLNEQGRGYAKKYSADYYREKHLRRRGRELAAGGACTEADLARMHRVQRGSSFYCGQNYGDTYEVDHFLPVAAGGHSGPENMVIACRLCNRSKGDNMPWEFMPERFAPPETE